MHIQHESLGLELVLVENLHQDAHNELHRRVVVVVKYDTIASRFPGLRSDLDRYVSFRVWVVVPFGRGHRGAVCSDGDGAPGAVASKVARLPAVVADPG
jgi:hypothetical protein